MDQSNDKTVYDLPDFKAMGAPRFFGPRAATNMEEMFIKHLGRWSDRGMALSRLVLLQGYLRGIKQRVIWGEIDSDLIIHMVNVEIERELRSSRRG